MSEKNTTRQPTANIPPFGLRMQPELKARVEELAKSSGRSMNSMIVHMIQSYFDEIARDEYENSPEYWEDLDRVASEQIDLEPAKSVNEYLANKRVRTGAAHTLIDQEIMKEASERGAEAAIKRLLESMKEVQAENPDRENYLDYALKILTRSALPWDNGEFGKNPPTGTPKIPGVNAPKGGSKAPKK